MDFGKDLKVVVGTAQGTGISQLGSLFQWTE